MIIDRRSAAIRFRRNLQVFDQQWKELEFISPCSWLLGF